MTKYLAFDLEIAKTVPFSQDLNAHRPLGITCAAAWASDQENPIVWCGRGKHGEIAPAMSADEVAAMTNHLQALTYQGYTLLTFNGAGFDFRCLADDGGDPVVCKSLVLAHVDMYFHLFCLLGYGPRLGRAAKGMGLAGKTEGMDGALAPEMWQRGDYGKVLQYVAQDVRTTLDLAMAVESAGELRWVSKSERPMSIKVRRWLTVTEALDLPLPDTSWMKDGWTRDKFVGWAL
jgi:hypothetical protein